MHLSYIVTFFLLLLQSAWSQMNPSPALLQVPDPRQEDNFIIALANVRDFGAKGDGQTDDTAAFSRAIKSVVQKGGGTVYVPAGHYAVKGNLIVPKSVYLCGEWKNPDKHPESMAQGTLLLAYSGRNQPDGKAFITVGGSAGLIGITIYYPEQTPEAPAAYAPTIELSDRLDGNSTGCSALQRVTLINPYVGVRAGIDCVQLQILDGIYVSPISQGVFIRISWDVPRLHNISIGPKYWQSFDSKLKGVEKIPGIMRENASGMVLGHSTWNFIYNLSISDCKVGVHFFEDPTFKKKWNELC